MLTPAVALALLCTATAQKADSCYGNPYRFADPEDVRPACSNSSVSDVSSEFSGALCTRSCTTCSGTCAGADYKQQGTCPAGPKDFFGQGTAVCMPGILNSGLGCALGCTKGVAGAKPCPVSNGCKCNTGQSCKDVGKGHGICVYPDYPRKGPPPPPPDACQKACSDAGDKTMGAADKDTQMAVMGFMLASKKSMTACADKYPDNVKGRRRLGDAPSCPTFWQDMMNCMWECDSVQSKKDASDYFSCMAEATGCDDPSSHTGTIVVVLLLIVLLGAGGGFLFIKKLGPFAPKQESMYTEEPKL